eukprot:GHUV01013194.1.p1 GENE.GHUV01013194.1~~GHUV01013194.1.p1  ORF type:complete len:293 (+),score=89.64 GHUV01013194.1:2555-3433(+)
MMLTNLRLIWSSKKQGRTNISIGYNNVTSLTVRPASSRLKGNSSALYVLTKMNQQRFEFIFTALTEGNPSLPVAVQAVVAAYEASRLYRELRLRGAVLADKELKLLPREAAYSKVNGVWNLSSETGNLGTFYITNVRVVWHSNTNLSFNVSIPYLQVKSVRSADSKFGPALVIETSPQSGGYVLGFKVDPKETLDYVNKEMNSLLQAYATNPIFGVEYDANASLDIGPQSTTINEDSEVLDSDTRGDAWATYYADDANSGGGGGELVYSPELGLAIEVPRDGATLQQLWSIL